MRKPGYDKWKHFYVGMLLGIFFQIVLQFHLNVSFWQALGINMLLVNGIGFGFELFSKITGWGHAELNDALATLLGGIASAIVICMLQYMTG